MHCKVINSFLGHVICQGFISLTLGGGSKGWRLRVTNQDMLLLKIYSNCNDKILSLLEIIQPE